MKTRTVECEACAGTGRYGFRDDDECPKCHGGGSIEEPMKPHEETWSANVKGAAMICNEDGHGQGVFMFNKDDRERARLAAQAPAMARLLLESQWAGDFGNDCVGRTCPWCGGMPEGEEYLGTPNVGKGHAPNCELAIVLRAAGVLP